MNDLQRILDAHGRRTASVVTAVVVSRNRDGSYRVRNLATGSERDVERASAGDEFAPGEFVTVGSPSNSRAVLGARDVILSRSRQQRGAAGTAPDEETTTISTPAIFGVAPDPLEIEAGGANGELVIYGTGFAGLAPSYGDAGISDDAAPIVTPTQITATISAGAAVEPGDYDLSVGSATRRGAIRVLPAPAVARSYYTAITSLDALGNGTAVAQVVRDDTGLPDPAYDGVATPQMFLLTDDFYAPYHSGNALPGWTIPAEVVITAGEGVWNFVVPMPGPTKPGGLAAEIGVRLSGVLGVSMWIGRYYMPD